MSCERRKFLHVCTTGDRAVSDPGMSSGPGCFRCGRDGAITSPRRRSRLCGQRAPRGYCT